MEEINKKSHEELEGEEMIYEAVDDGKEYPFQEPPAIIRLKCGDRVMVTKNVHPFFNGMCGVVVAFKQIDPIEEYLPSTIPIVSNSSFFVSVLVYLLSTSVCLFVCVGTIR